MHSRVGILKRVLITFCRNLFSWRYKWGGAVFHRNGLSVRCLQFERLDVRQLMAVDVLESEPNNDETQANRFEWAGQTEVRLLGTSQGKDDKDYFVFTSPADTRVNVNVVSAAGAKLEVNASNGTQVFENEPGHGLTSGWWQAAAGESYRLRLRAPDQTPAVYAVSLTTGQGSGSGNSSGGNSNVISGAEVEPNNKPDLATSAVLSASAPISLTGNASKRDRDFFRVQTDSAGMVTIDTGNSGIKVSLETSQGVKLFESEPQDGITRASFDAAAGSVFFVRARGTSGDVTHYSLALTLAAGTNAGQTGSTDASNTVRDAWLDSSDDGMVSPIDALMVINHINSHGAGHAADDALLGLDTNDDRVISALDVLLVVNRINQHGSSDVNDAFDDSDIRKRNRT